MWYLEKQFRQKQYYSLPVRFLDSTASRGPLSRSFCSKLLPWCFASCRFPCCLLCSRHDTFNDNNVV